MKEVRLGNGGPPGRALWGGSHDQAGAEGWRAVTRVLRSSAATLTEDLLSTFFPSDCRVCGLPLTGSVPVPVCTACVAAVVPQSGHFCPRCGESMGFESIRQAQSLGQTECVHCRVDPPAFTRAVAFAEYGDEVREALHLLKFGKARATAQHVLGARLAAAIAQLEDQLPNGAVVVPVPLFHTRLKERGFNQADLLAAAALKSLRSGHPHWKLTLAPQVLTRVKPAPPLYALAPQQRRSRLQGSFAVQHPHLIAGRDVLLIDDILTTGATADACAGPLLRAGAARVFVATVARAQKDGVLHQGAGSTDIARWENTPTPF